MFIMYLAYVLMKRLGPESFYKLIDYLSDVNELIWGISSNELQNYTYIMYHIKYKFIQSILHFSKLGNHQNVTLKDSKCQHLTVFPFPLRHQKQHTWRKSRLFLYYIVSFILIWSSGWKKFCYFLNSISNESLPRLSVFSPFCLVIFVIFWFFQNQILFIFINRPNLFDQFALSSLNLFCSLFFFIQMNLFNQCLSGP